MIKILTCTFFALFLGLTQWVSAQTTKTDENNTGSPAKVTFNEDLKFECGEAAYDEEKQLITLTEQVSLKSEIFEFSGASRVVYDDQTRKLTIYDCTGFSIKGKVVVQDNVARVKIIEYTLGDDTVYLM